MYLKEVMKSAPFSNRLIIDKAERALDFKNEKILLASFEADYLFYGIKIKELLEKNNNSVVALSLDDKVYKQEVFDSLALGASKIVCVGNIEIINLLRYFFSNKHIYYVPTNLVFYASFSRECYIIKNGNVLSKQAELPTVIVDIDIFPKLKLRNIADSFCSVAVSSFWKIDYYLYSIINGIAQNERAKTAIDEAHKVLSKINSNNCYEILLSCQIWLSLAVYLDSRLDTLTDLSVGIIFNRLSQSTMEECRFFAVEYLLKLYKATLQVSLEDNLIYPDYLTNILRLTELFDSDKSEYLETHKVIKDSYLASALRRVRESGVEAMLDSLIKVLPSYKNAYKNLYKARKVRAKFEIEDSLKAISLAGVTSKSYLKLLFDSGILQLIEKI